MYARFFNAPDGSTPLSQLAKLDTNKIKSYSYTAKFAGAGEFTLLLHFIPEYLGIIRLNDMIHYDGDWLIIKNIKYDESAGITLSGTDLNGILSQRLALPGQAISGTTAECISYFLNKNIMSGADSIRQMPMSFNANGVIGISDDGYKCLDYENLSDVICTLCDWAGIGFRIEAGREFIFKLLQGTDCSAGQNENPWVIFSPGWGNVLQQSFEHDISNMYNAVYAVNSDTGVVQVGYRDSSVTSGISRQETMVELSADTTDDLIKYALAETEDNVETHIYSVIPVSEGFGRDYFLGDKVSVRDKYTGNMFSAVITEVEKNYSGSEKSIKLTLGKQKPKLLNRIINNMIAGVQKRR